MYEIRAKVMTLGGYSGHADQAQLVAFAHGCNARRIVLVHGEGRAKQVLARVLKETLAQVGNEMSVTVAE
ncbi:RNA-metabolising metallo-beta-lactamase [compost metagenome]